MYSDESLAAAALNCGFTVFGIGNFLWTSWTFHCFLLQRKNKLQATGKASSARKNYALPIRVAHVLTAAFACVLSILTAVAPLIYVSPSTKLDPFGPPADLDALDSASRYCTASTKLGAGCYAYCKLFSYLFYFIKQRIVRPLSQPSLLEKIVLALTLGIVLFGVVMMVASFGDVNTLDGTCQIFIPLYIIIPMALADASLSLLYLYLFIQPLRETIQQNQKAKSYSAKVAPSDPALQLQQKEKSNQDVEEAVPAAGPVVANLALEGVMRKNTYTCIVTVCFSMLSMLFLLVSHAVNDQHSRKFNTTSAQLDVTATGLALTYIMHTASSSSANSNGNKKRTQGGAMEVKVTQSTLSNTSGGGGGRREKNPPSTQLMSPPSINTNQPTNSSNKKAMHARSSSGSVVPIQQQQQPTQQSSAQVSPSHAPLSTQLQQPVPPLSTRSPVLVIPSRLFLPAGTPSQMSRRGGGGGGDEIELTPQVYDLQQPPTGEASAAPDSALAADELTLPNAADTALTISTIE